MTTAETIIDRVRSSHDDQSCRLVIATWRAYDMQGSFTEYLDDLTRAVAWAREEPYRTVRPVHIVITQFDGQCADEIEASKQEVEIRVAETFGLKDLEEVLV
jgi:hypothetical protein